MDGYKKIIKSPKMRATILNMFSFLPDSIMLKIQYKMKTGRALNLKTPERFTEKLQWYKINYRNPVMHKIVDKYEVREYVTSKGLGNVLIPLIGKYSSVSEIDWNKLPNEFVIKTTNGGGGLNVFVCPDKTKISFDELLQKFSDIKPSKPRSLGREWAYYGLQPGLVVEELLVNEDNSKAGVNDYKIFCYGGKPKYIIVDVDRYIGHKRNFYDAEWNNLHITSDCPASDREIEKPKNYDEMLRVASKLSEGFPYVRVDLYNVEGKIYFGELTFYPWSGYVKFSPDKWDYRFGEEFNLNKKG